MLEKFVINKNAVYLQRIKRSFFIFHKLLYIIPFNAIFIYSDK